MQDNRKNSKPKAAIASYGVTLLAAFWLVFAPVVSADQWKINFNETEINELVKFVADATGMTIVVDPKVKGKVKVISTKSVNTEELYELFLSILEVHGFAAVKSGDVLRIVPTKDARSLPVPVSGGTGGEIVTHVIQLKNVAAAKLIPILRPMVPQQAHMAAYAPSNSIIISDTAANINRIRTVISQMDRSADQSTSVVKLKHAAAEEVVRLLENLEKTDTSKDASAARVSLVADTRTNTVLVTGDKAERIRIRSLISHLDSPLDQSGNARVIYLKYAKAKELAETLGKVVQNMAKLDSAKPGAKPNTGASSRGGSSTIEADEATNALIITADAAIMSTLESMIARLDIRRAQVLVEAIIVELQAIDNKDLGVQWVAADKNAGFGSSSNGDGLLTSIGAAALDNGQDTTTTVTTPQGGSTVTTTPDDGLINLAGALANNIGQTFGIGKLNEDGTSFVAIINALEEDTEANILSTPSLLTLDNSPASISVGQNVPFLTGSFTNASGDGVNNPFQTIERENVGISLNVTPSINEGDSVILEIEQEVSSLTGTVASDIITNERSVSATVLAKDGEIIVLGGLIKDEVQETMRKVPLLGDIPLLGRLFRSTGTSVNKTNLYVFIKPTIIRDSVTMSGATAEKYKYIRTQQLNRKLRGVDLVDTDKLPLLPEWEEQLRELQQSRVLKNETEAVVE
ncbi:MAG: type II secretion system secretin GspD [Pseudomonadales bacterium]